MFDSGRELECVTCGIVPQAKLHDAYKMFHMCTEHVGKLEDKKANPLTWEEFQTCQNSLKEARKFDMITEDHFEMADTDKNSLVEYKEWIIWLNQQ